MVLRSNFVFLYVLFAMMFAFTSHAQQDLIKRSSPDRDVAIAFYKLSRTFPDFEKWASFSQDAATALEDEKEDVIEAQVRAEQLAFARYDYLTQPITIRAVVTVSVADNEDGPPILSIKFDNQKTAFFPFSYADEQFAVIAENLDALSSIPISLVEARYIAERLPLDGQILLVMDVMPYKTSRKKELQQEGQSYNALFSKVGALSLYNSELALVWNWQAIWLQNLKSIAAEARAR